MARAHPQVALCLEQTLGHRTHGQNIEAESGHDASVRAIHVDPPERDRMHIPWAVRASWQARRKLGPIARTSDVALFHTQSVSLFARQCGIARYVVSVDATPLQVDAIGTGYRHRQHPAPIERWKRARYRSVFRDSSAAVAWSHWAADSLTQDYGVDSTAVLVAHPGAPAAFFGLQRPACAPARKPTVLFVGGDFERKGGPLLLDAWRRLQTPAGLVCVTSADLAPERGLTVVHDVRPGSEQLLSLYRDADLFCLPTSADCTPVVIGEAMAAGLPVVTTNVGSNPEWVQHGETGLLFEAGDGDALGVALGQLVDDGAQRRRMGAAARAFARDNMDAGANARRILELLRGIA